MSRAAGDGRRRNKALWSWCLYDWANQAFATVIQTFVFAAYFTTQVAAEPERGTSHWSLTIGLAGLCVAVSGPVLGAIADRSGRRKPWLAVNTLICAVATAGLWLVHPRVDDYFLALGLLGIATFSSQAAFIFYNAMLGDLAPRREYGRWSGRGWALGYAGGVCCLLLVFLLFVREGALLPLEREAASHIRAAFPFVAVWLIVFSLPLFLIAPDRAPSRQSWRESVTQGFRQLRDSVANIRRYRKIVRFLVAWSFCMDGLATVFALGGVYAAGSFGMDERGVLLFGISLSVVAGLGAAGFSWVDERIGSRRAILFSVAGLLLFSSLILLVTDVRWFWLWGLLLGLFVGPVQASSRSYLTQVAPAELRGEMFGVYAFAGKASAFLGPLLVSALTAVSDSQRIGLTVIPVFFAIGWLILRGVPAGGAD